MIPVVRVTIEVMSALKLLCQGSFPRMPSVTKGMRGRHGDLGAAHHRLSWSHLHSLLLLQLKSSLNPHDEDGPNHVNTWVPTFIM